MSDALGDIPLENVDGLIHGLGGQKILRHVVQPGGDDNVHPASSDASATIPTSWPISKVVGSTTVATPRCLASTRELTIWSSTASLSKTWG